MYTQVKTTTERETIKNKTPASSLHRLKLPLHMYSNKVELPRCYRKRALHVYKDSNNLCVPPTTPQLRNRDVAGPNPGALKWKRRQTLVKRAIYVDDIGGIKEKSPIKMHIKVGLIKKTGMRILLCPECLILFVTNDSRHH